MSHKKPNQRIHTLDQNAKTSEGAGVKGQGSSSSLSSGNVISMARSSIGTVAETVSSNWKLVGGVAAVCGTAAFLLGTSQGRRVHTMIQDQAANIYDLAGEQLSSGYSKLREMVQGITSGDMESVQSD